MEEYFERLASFGERPFIQDNKGIISYAEILQSIEALWPNLKDHLSGEPGTVVGFKADNKKKALVHLMACARIGAIALPYKGDLPEEVAELLDLHCLDDGSYKTGSAKPFELKKKIRHREEAGLIISSSGSSGKAKWVMHSLDQLLGKYLKLKHARTVVHWYDLDNISGIELFTSISCAGGALLLVDDANNAEIQSLVKQSPLTPDLISSTPSFLRFYLLACGNSGFEHVKDLNLGGEILAESQVHFFKGFFPEAAIHSFYGSTESSSIQTETLQGSNAIKWGEEGVDFKIESGELFLKRRQGFMLGYLFNQHQKSEWFATNDLVEAAPSGYYRVIGRKDRKINVGGQLADPGRVETVLRNHPAVEDAFVYGRKNELLGFVLQADIIAIGEINMQDLRKYCHSRLLMHEIPFGFKCVENLAFNHRLKRKAHE